MNKLSIPTQLSRQDYLKICFTLKYKSIRGYVSIGLAIFYYIIGIFLLIKDPQSSIIVFVSGFVYMTITNLMFYLKSYSQFTSNKKLQEMICYSFGENSIKITGETFESTFSTKSIYKVTSTKNWLLVMLNADNFYAISRDNLDEENILTLSTIFRTMW
jgi:hypothetical protein